MKIIHSHQSTTITLLLFSILLSIISNHPSHAFNVATPTTRALVKSSISSPHNNVYKVTNLKKSQKRITSPLFAETTTNNTGNDDIIISDDDSSEKKKGIFGRVMNMFKPKSSENLSTKELLAKMGLSALLSYGFVSNMSYCVTVSLAWFGFTKKTGLSPLAPEQWKGFLAVYAGFYVFNNIIRPLRVGISIGVAKYFDAAISKVQNMLKVSKPISIGIVVFLANIVGTCSLMSLGIAIASSLSGVPIFPPKV